MRKTTQICGIWFKKEKTRNNNNKKKKQQKTQKKKGKRFANPKKGRKTDRTEGIMT